MFEITLLNTTLFALLFIGIFYGGACLYNGGIIKLRLKKLLFYVTIFSLFGIVGEVFVNTLYAYIFNAPLWEYRLFPAHDGNISYFFIFIWGSLGVYKCVMDSLFNLEKKHGDLYAGFLMGAEAILIELIYNGSYLLLFGDYIFYYLPENLGPLSHLSCLQVLPFYFMFGLVVSVLMRQEVQGKVRSVFVLGFYWMIILTFVLLV